MSDSVFAGSNTRFAQWRKFKDKAAAVGITAGGSGVLFAILLIFFYLLYEIMPLFQSAHMEQTQRYARVGSPAPTLHMAVEEQAEVGFRLAADGTYYFFSVSDGSIVSEGRLNLPADAEITSFNIDSENSRIFAVGLADGRMLIARHHYKISYPNDERLITPVLQYPYADEPIRLADSSLQKITLRNSEEALVAIAYTANGGLEGRRWVKEEDFLTEEITLVEENLTLPDLDIKPHTILLGPTQDWLYVLSHKGQYRLVDVDEEEVVDAGVLFDNALLTDARFLLGGYSVLVSNSAGETAQWFNVKSDGAVHFEKIRSFRNADKGIVTVSPEHRRKGFVTVNDAGQLDIYYSTSQRHLASTKLPEPATKMAIAPRAETLLIETQGGELLVWEIENEHPEVSWSVLWEKVWYESYPEPDYIWQSSASTNDFEPKYSFAPLAFGTLKAAFYAMIIAAPLAVCGAIYTAYFMAPAMRRKVKPLIELMEALPTVILGFLAGLWLAPFVEKHLPAVFSIFLFMPIGVLLFAWLWNYIPMRFRKHVPDGWHPLLVAPVIILVVVVCVWMSAPVERVLFDGDMRAWFTAELGISFDQRNALVVGIAMGFAVIPTIFSIAEDAIFSVPKHLSYGSLALGATPWQTLVGVVMPTASPGIFSALMIGMGRAVGETMIVLMATGNTPVMDMNIFEGMRTLAANIAVEIGETEVDSSHYRVLFLAAFVLFMFTFVVNTLAEIVRQRLRNRYGNL
ncbi:phosphate transport system permease protein [Litorivivens lipolytica]|uniref:Phosphate transport system permease protein n=1 Tax=Litorivivens lipolytica TaxID=1524264 RepID=A0A7W4W391_9GAMM|nr:phosphate transport system permease protein [Litorivivens lipolytica]